MQTNFSLNHYSRRSIIWISILSKARERSDRALGSEENSGRMLPIDSEMAGPIGQKTWWDDRGHGRERPREGWRWDESRFMIHDSDSL